MKKILIVLFLFVLTYTVLYSIDVNPPSGPYYVGDLIRFNATDSTYSFYPGTLYFGDGTRINNVVQDTGWWGHRYKEPGTYNLLLRDEFMFLAPDEFRTLVIEENRGGTANHLRSIFL